MASVTEGRMADRQLWNPWTLAAIGIVMVCATALLTGVVVAHYSGVEQSAAGALPAAAAAAGAVGSAMAGGGAAAGQGAGIGGFVGAAAGRACGPDEANRSDARAEAAYRACLRQSSPDR